MTSPVTKAEKRAPVGDGVDRVAALLLSMGSPLAARLIKYFQPEEIRAVTRSVAELRPVPAPALHDLVDDFAAQFAVGAHLVGAASEAERMLEGSVPKELADEIMGDILGGRRESLWEQVSSLDEKALVEFLSEEHPQTAAYVLSRVNSNCAAKVLGRLPARARITVLRRMLSVKPLSEPVERMLQRIIQKEVATRFPKRSSGEGFGRIAEIINKLEREQVDQVLQGLATTKPGAAESLKSMMFKFEDIAKLSPSSRTKLFEKVPSETTIMALRGADAELRTLVLAALSGRMRKMIEQELGNGNQVRQRDVLAARRTVTDLVLQLEGRGEISLGDDDKEEYVS